MNRRSFLKAGGVLAVGTIVSRRAIGAPLLAQDDYLAIARAALSRHGAAVPHRDVVAVADFNMHSSKPRFHLIDMTDGRTTHLLVAHGKGSDPGRSGWLTRFSNKPGSNATSAGSYVTGETYVGQHGQSRRLIGLDPDNDEALARAIVIHGADYVSYDRAATGPIGRSFGCFAFAQSDISQVLARLGPGRLLVAYKS